MDALLESKQMEGIEPIVQAQRAIAHTLNYASQDPEVGYFINIGSQSFELLTEALATITQKPLAEVRERFMCRKARPPGRNELMEACRRIEREHLEDDHISSAAIREAIQALHIAEGRAS